MLLSPMSNRTALITIFLRAVYKTTQVRAYYNQAVQQRGVVPLDDVAGQTVGRSAPDIREQQIVPRTLVL